VTPAAPWRVTSCALAEGYRLHVRFVDGTEGMVDLSRRLDDPGCGIFAVLRDPAVFAKAEVRMGAVTWPDGPDLAPDAMYDAIRRDGIWTPGK
jgi:hypothetical protein